MAFADLSHLADEVQSHYKIIEALSHKPQTIAEMDLWLPRTRSPEEEQEWRKELRRQAILETKRLEALARAQRVQAVMNTYTTGVADDEQDDPEILEIAMAMSKAQRRNLRKLREAHAMRRLHARKVRFGKTTTCAAEESASVARVHASASPTTRVLFDIDDNTTPPRPQSPPSSPPQPSPIPLWDGTVTLPRTAEDDPRPSRSPSAGLLGLAGAPPIVSECRSTL
jgi:hypothetical protein